MADRIDLRQQDIAELADRTCCVASASTGSPPSRHRRARQHSPSGVVRPRRQASRENRRARGCDVAMVRRVLVVGGGITGLTKAAALHQRSFDVEHHP